MYNSSNGYMVDKNNTNLIFGPSLAVNISGPGRDCSTGGVDNKSEKPDKY